MDAVRVTLLKQYARGMRDSAAGMAEFSVEDLPSGEIAIAPLEGAGTVRRYFDARKVADARTAIEDDEPWAFLAVNPPVAKPELRVPSDIATQYDQLRRNPALTALVQRLGVAVGLTEVENLAAVFRQELPTLFERYPNGSLWYVSVDPVLMKRLAFIRITFQQHLAPDAPFGEGRQGITYFGAHHLTHGVMFGEAVQPILLAFSPVIAGFVMPAPPSCFVFIFGQFDDEHDLRTRAPGHVARSFFPLINAHPAVPGIKVPMDALPLAHIEALLGWWATRLNILYSYAADPTRFATATGQHDPAAQLAWFLTFERMLGDFEALGAAVDSPGVLRIQGGFDALDKAASLLAGPRGNDAAVFRRLLHRADALPRVLTAFEQLPMQLQARFRSWAQLAFDRLYDDIADQTMPARRTANGVLVGHDSPTDLREELLDDYVGDLIREARNASHGLLNTLTRPMKPGKRPVRLLLATNEGDVPASFYEVARAVIFGLLADAERLCNRAWF